MICTREMFGKSMGDVFTLFLTLREEQDHRAFYFAYREVIASTQPAELVDGIVHSNLGFMLGKLEEDPQNKNRVDRARRIWWFI